MASRELYKTLAGETTQDTYPHSPPPPSTRPLFLDDCRGVTALAIAIFAIFPIYWGSVWKTPHHTLPGWIVDSDGGAVGLAVSGALTGINPGTNGISWKTVPASQFPSGIIQLENEIVQEKTWYALTSVIFVERFSVSNKNRFSVNAGASANLTAAVSTVDGVYNSSLAITFIGSEARNENIYRIHKSIVSLQLDAMTHQFALQSMKALSSSANVSSLLSRAPELLARSIYYTTANLRPFDIPVASAVTFVGLIYLLILSFFVVMIAAGAREASGLEQRLSLGSLVRMRLMTSFVAYLLIYTLLSRAFQLPFDRAFGRAGLVVSWMLNWVSMLACGLALEYLITLLTQRFISFFLLLWIITNVSVSVFPLQVLPHVYRNGYAFPFYNISRAVRSIIFLTKNDVGLNFGVLIAWVALSCFTIPLFQWFMRRHGQSTAAKI